MAPDPIRTGSRPPGRTTEGTRPTEAGAPAAATPAAGSEDTAASDRFEENAPRPGGPLEPTRNGGLPDVLLSSDRATVRHGTDPGDFYCEHMYFLAQRAAEAPGSSVLRNSQGERLVGFLHVPGDQYRYGEPGQGYTLDERHAGTREVVGAALRGYVDAIAPQVGDGPVKVLLTGYGQWGGTTNNPTGEFVQHRANIDQAMRSAFGDDLLSPEGRSLFDAPAPSTAPTGYAYRVRVPGTEREREVQLHLASFKVDDSALDENGDHSIQRAMADAAPHGVISMGVHGARHFEVEHHADSGELSIGPPPRHDGRARPDEELPDNYALARAVYEGGKTRGVAAGGVLGFLATHATDEPGG